MAASRPNTWMPMFWGDYLRDTGHLSTAEHGAYMLLIGHYWTTGQPLADNDHTLARITRQTVVAWRKMREAIVAFFTVADGSWHHGRIDAELDRALRFIERQAANGSRGGRPRKPNKTQEKPTANPNHIPLETTSEPPSHSYPHGEDHSGAARASASPDGPPRTPLPASAQWAERLAGYRPWEGKRTWQPFWGPRPDSLQRNAAIEHDAPTLLKAWLEEYRAAKARGECS
jgi:uncharacterized protein YdaU (DUF1376 family)